MGTSPRRNRIELKKDYFTLLFYESQKQKKKLKEEAQMKQEIKEEPQMKQEIKEKIIHTESEREEIIEKEKESMLHKKYYLYSYRS